MSQQYSLIANIVAKTDSFMKSMNEAKGKSDEVAKNFADKSKAIGEGFGKVGKSLTTKVTLPLVGMAAGGVAAFKNFDDSMRNTQALLGDKLGGTIEEQEKNLKMLTDEAKRMGATTAHSASASADAMGYMALAGWDTTQIMAGIEPVLNLASAAGMDLAQTSDIVTDAMSMYSMEASEAERMTDVLAATSSSTNTDVAQLGEALKRVGANAAASGMDIEQTSAFLGVLADNGLKGSTAGTTLNAMLRDMKDKAVDGKLAIGDTSVALYDAEGNMRDMTDVTEEMIAATVDMTDAERDQALATIFGSESLKGFNILASESPEKLRELEESLRNSEGTASGMAKVLEGGLGGAFRSLGSATEAAAIAIGETLAPYIQKAADFITSLLLKFTEMDDKTKKFIMIFAGIAAAIGPFFLILGKVFTVVSGLITTFSGAGAAIAGMATPVGWVIGILAGLIAIGILLYKNWETIKDKAIEVFDNFRPLFDTLKNSFQTFMDGLQPTWETLKTLFSSLMPILEIIGALVGGVLVTAFGIAISIFSATVAAINPFIQAVINIVDIVVNMVNVVVALLTGDFAGAWDYLKDIGQSTMDFFVNIFDTIITFIGTFVQTIVDFFHGLYITLVGNSIIPDMVNAIVKWFKNLGKWAVDLVKDLVKKVVDFFTNLYTNATNIFNNAKNAISNAFSAAKKFVVDTALAIYNEIKNRFNNILTNVSSIFSSIRETISNLFTSAKEKIVTIATSIYTSAKSKFESLKTSVTTIFDNIKTSITKPIETARDTVKRIVDAIKGFFTGMKLSIPSIKLPKLPKPKITGSFSLTPPSVPKISWNKLGGVFRNATIFPTGSPWQGVGEGGSSEAILPLNSKTYAGLAKGIVEQLSFNANPQLVNNIDKLVHIENFYGTKKEKDDLASILVSNLAKRGIR